MPDTSSQRLGNTNANTDGNTNYEKSDQDLNDNSVPLAEVCQAIARSLHLSSLRLSFPVVLARPHLAVIGRQLAAAQRFPAVELLLAGRGDHCLDVCVEGIIAVACARSRRLRGSHHIDAKAVLLGGGSECVGVMGGVI